MVGASALAFWGTACQQAQIDCRVLHTEFVAQYKLVKDGGPECSAETADFMGLQSYYAATSDKKVDLSRSLLALRPSIFLGLLDEAGANGDDTTVLKADLDATGDFTSTEPDSGGACKVTSMNPIEVSINAIPSNMGEDPMDPADDYPGHPAESRKLEWRNIRLLVSPANPGNLFKGDLTYTVNNCAATYSVTAMAPIVGCEDPNNAGMPLDKLCDGEADLDLGIPFGSGISQDFKPKCDPNLLVCVPTDTALLQ